MNIGSVKVICPLCSHINKVDLEDFKYMFKPSIFICDCEGGGCDECFAAKLKILDRAHEKTLSVTTYELVEKRG